MALFCDNCATIDFANNYWICKLSNHIDIHHHRVQKLVYDKTFLLLYIRTTDNLVDMYPIDLPEIELCKLRSMVIRYNAEEF
jgi:hypothetical protein